MLRQNTQEQHCSVLSYGGFTLAELAIILGIIGLILGAVWFGSSGIYASTDATVFAQKFGQYVGVVRTYCDNSVSACATTPGVQNFLPNLALDVPVILPGVVEASAPGLGGAQVGANPGTIVIGYDIDTTLSAGRNACIAMSIGAQQLGAISDTSFSNVTNDFNSVPGLAAGICVAAGATPSPASCLTQNGPPTSFPVNGSCRGMGDGTLGYCYSAPIPETVCQHALGSGGTLSLVLGFNTAY